MTAASRWYEAQRLGPGRDFLGMLDRAFGRIDGCHLLPRGV